MFEYNMAQIKALQNIKGQLVTRKQRVEDIMWEILQDVIYLRTRNGGAEKDAAGSNTGGRGGGGDRENKIMEVGSATVGGYQGC